MGKIKVKSVVYAGREDVYNMEVEDTHNFVVGDGASGIVAHNCYDETRYFLMSRPLAPRIVVPPKLKVYSPLD